MNDNPTRSIRTLGDILHWGEKQFTSENIYFGHGTDNAWDEAVYLACHVLNLPVDASINLLRRKLTVTEIDEILKFFQKRIEERIPAAYLTHESWFAGIPFYVDERVLIPRSPLAELIESSFAPWIAENNVHKILDIGTGSGCIAIACALVFPESKVDAIDVSAEALEVAKINVEKYDLRDRVRLLRSDVFSAIPQEIYDVIISNPPYVAVDEFADLPKEYSHEPHQALAAGKHGIDIVERILKEADKHLCEHGILIVEVGDSQKAVSESFRQMPFLWLEFERGGGGVFLLTKKQLQNW